MENAVIEFSLSGNQENSLHNNMIFEIIGSYGRKMTVWLHVPCRKRLFQFFTVGCTILMQV